MKLIVTPLTKLNLLTTCINFIYCISTDRYNLISRPLFTSLVRREGYSIFMYLRSVVGKRGLWPSTWHWFLLQYLPHILRRENQRRPRMMMGWRGWRCHSRAVQLTSPVALEFDGTSAPRGSPGTTPSESEPWWPPSTHDCGAGQETAPLVGPRGEAVRTLLGQQASSFAVPIFTETFVAPSITPSRLRGRLHRLSLRQSGYARCHVSLGTRMNHYHWDVSGR